MAPTEPKSYDVCRRRWSEGHWGPLGMLPDDPFHLWGCHRDPLWGTKGPPWGSLGILWDTFWCLNVSKKCSRGPSEPLLAPNWPNIKDSHRFLMPFGMPFGSKLKGRTMRIVWYLWIETHMGHFSRYDEKYSILASKSILNKSQNPTLKLPPRPNLPSSLPS